jgi:hypothetical protein
MKSGRSAAKSGRDRHVAKLRREPALCIKPALAGLSDVTDEREQRP